ncbi:MAG: hypothetical protein LCH59_13725 [Proteobacteria bacterium]|nr:hypothetical protein [Pseudomonadota bacterium]
MYLTPFCSDKMKYRSPYAEAAEALRAKDGVALMKKAVELIGSDSDPYRAAGYLLRGGLYEYGATGICRDLDKSIDDYRQATLLSDDAISNWYMGRVLLKSGCHLQARKFLEIACREAHPPDVEIDMGRLYERGLLEDDGLALSYFRKAAIRGRVGGIKGCIRVLINRGDKGGQIFASLLAVLYIISIPAIWIVFGLSRDSCGIALIMPPSAPTMDCAAGA